MPMRSVLASALSSAILGSARVSRAGDGVLAIANFTGGTRCPNGLATTNHGEHHRRSLTSPIASSDKVAPDEISQTPLRPGSGGNGCAVLHSNLCHAWLRCSLLDARAVRYEASTSRRKTSH